MTTAGVWFAILKVVLVWLFGKKVGVEDQTQEDGRRDLRYLDLLSHGKSSQYIETQKFDPLVC